MVEVFVFAEGQTEEQFIKRVVAPVFRPLSIFIKPQLLSTSGGGKGGAVTFDRLKFHARNTLRMKSAPVLSTFIDLYALDTDFPGYYDANRKAEVYERVAFLEEALHKAIINDAGCRPERFIPHIQPYEFEGLLFSDVAALCETEQKWQGFLQKLREIREEFATPEHINDGYDTKPSKRLEGVLCPTYRKTRHGPLSAERITLAVMENECPHLRGWLGKLKTLAHGAS